MYRVCVGSHSTLECRKSAPHLLSHDLRNDLPFLIPPPRRGRVPSSPLPPESGPSQSLGSLSQPCLYTSRASRRKLCIVRPRVFPCNTGEAHCSSDTGITLVTIALFFTICRLVVRICDGKLGWDDFWAAFSIPSSAIMLTGILMMLGPPRTILFLRPVIHGLTASYYAAGVAVGSFTMIASYYM